MKINPLTAADFYKIGHFKQYPKGTQLVYSNFTPRSDERKNIPSDMWTGHIVFFGLQYFIKDFLINSWRDNFFHMPKEYVLAKYKRRMDNALGQDAITLDHIAALHDLQYLPICIRALPEGTLVPMRVPCLVIYNTKPEFYWLTNYLETALSAYLWKPITSATTAYHYHLLFEKYADITGADKDFIKFQGHDFSFRGMSGIEDAAAAGAGHLTSFAGTDTIPAIDLMELYYNADAEKELIGCSVSASEHSVMTMGGPEKEFLTIKRLVTEVYPKGIVSLVADSYDFWKFITEYILKLKDIILARDGKLVIRPDSGIPEKIICGDFSAPRGSPAYKGTVECLWEIFGGTLTDKGYKVLDSHIGVIYGDSISPERAQRILSKLMLKGFAPTNVVLGIGSYTYQMVTRDTYGFAVKSTYGIINEKTYEIFKDPVTDSGIKKSAKGLLKVVHNGKDYMLLDRQKSIEWEKGDCLENVFRDGVLLKDDSLAAIRKRINAHF